MSRGKLVRFFEGIKLLHKHHSTPKYRVSPGIQRQLRSLTKTGSLALQPRHLAGQLFAMSWNQRWARTDYQQWGWNQKGTGKGQKTKAPWKEPEEKNPKAFITAFDGTKLSYSYKPVSSASAGQKDKEDGESLGQIKSVIKDLAQGNKVDMNHPVIRQFLSEDTKDTLKEEQRNLNARRKCQRKVDNLRQQLHQKGKDFSEWKRAMKQAIKDEEARFKENEEKLQKDLENAENELAKKIAGEESMDEGPTNISDSEEESDKGKATRPSKREEYLEMQCQQLHAANTVMQQQITTCSAT